MRIGSVTVGRMVGTMVTSSVGVPYVFTDSSYAIIAGSASAVEKKTARCPPWSAVR